ncbi:nucleotide pyrophosphatase [Halorubrum sp. JWXQ-INN 858]|uniref:alkaline phosphatase family protein n=1 Tax=Halorubrum sp. JWXQ-INN 858 TaxID=2690782 RepID=UPI001357FB34|nr:alkaline phosphatase family protein [Halorubrum sp. JWXQ-INN 858]MWV65455.1 nucleotide pyrophosphatase [Halorubrum sp. JWXQ-INN 858]
MPPTVVVGLDGATFDLIGPWMERGDLPALRRIVDGGIHGELQSVLPPVTSPNWKAYATGKNPGKLGIYWWQNVDVRNRRVYLPRERYHEQTEYWEILAEQDRVGVINVPTTYPPKDVGEFLIAGPPDGHNEGYATPPSLERRLNEEFDYRVRKRGMLHDGNPEAYEEVLDLIDLRFRVARQLFEEYDLSFLQVTTFYLNSLHHHLWDGADTKRGWEIVDDHLSALLDADVDLVLMSDHGHAPIETVFNVNAWLERQGYLQYDSAVADTLYSAGINADRLKRVLIRADDVVPITDLRGVAERFAPQWFLNRLPNESGELGGSKHEAIDWDASVAVGSAQGPVYLIVDPESPRYERVREELMEAFGSLRDPLGRPVASAVHRGEEVYHGPYVESGPDIVIEKSDHVNVREGLGSDEVFPTVDPNWSGVNTRRGIFAAIGPSFRTGTVDDLSILDLAPTLLSLRGAPVPDDMDGRVRTSLFADSVEAP